MTSVRIVETLDPNLTYPTITKRGIVEMTPTQQQRYSEETLSLEERVARIEKVLMEQGLL